MREIKFRAYIKDREKALLKFYKEYLDKNNWVIPVTGMAFDRLNVNGDEYNNVGLRAANGRDVMFKESELELMQYTGIKDKAGLKIFDGDILLEDSSDDRWLVIFDEDDVAFKAENIQEPYNLHIYNKQVLGALSLSSYFKIIGNVHENKDLLK